jgi:hypothetical protein
MRRKGVLLALVKTPAGRAARQEQLNRNLLPRKACPHFQMVHEVGPNVRGKPALSIPNSI